MQPQATGCGEGRPRSTKTIDIIQQTSEAIAGAVEEQGAAACTATQLMTLSGDLDAQSRDLSTQV